MSLLIRAKSLSSAPVAEDGKSDEVELKPIRIVPSASVLVGGGTDATCDPAVLGAAFGGDGTLGLGLAMPGTALRGDGGTRGVTGGGGTAAGLGGLALGAAGVAIAVLGAGGVGFATIGTAGLGGTGARFGGGAFGIARAALVAAGGLGVGGAIFGGGIAFGRAVAFGASAAEEGRFGCGGGAMLGRGGVVLKAVCRDGRGGAPREAKLRGSESCDRGGSDGGGSKPPFDAGATGARPDRSIPGRVGCGPSLSNTLKSTMTLGRLEPGGNT